MESSGSFVSRFFGFLRRKSWVWAPSLLLLIALAWWGWHPATTGNKPGLRVKAEHLAVAGEVRLPPGRSFSDVTVSGSWTAWGDTTYKVHECGVVVPDAEGRFAFADLPRGVSFCVIAKAKGLAESQAAIMELTPENNRPLVLNLGPEAVIEGVVRDDAGHRLPGVAVVAQPSLDSGLLSLNPLHAKTDAQGHFRFGGLQGGLYTLRVAPHGNAVSNIELPVIVLNGATAYGELSAVPGKVLHGFVKGPADRGMKGIELTFIPQKDWVPEGQDKKGEIIAETDENGAFAVSLPLGTNTVWLRHWPYRYRPTDPLLEPTMLDNGDTRRRVIDMVPESPDTPFVVSLVLRDGEQPYPSEAAETATVTTANAKTAQPAAPSLLEGRIVTPEGKPFPRLSVWVKYKREGFEAPPDDLPPAALTKADGTYRFRVPAAPGTYLVLTEDYRTGLAESRPLSAVPGLTQKVPDLVAKEARGRLSGRAVDAAGQPIVGVRVIPRSAHKDYSVESAVTDLDGRFEVRNLLEGEPLELKLFGGGYADRHFHGLQPDTSGHLFPLYPDVVQTRETMPERGRLAVGKPVPEWKVESWLQDNGGLSPHRRDGTWTVLALNFAPESGYGEIETLCRLAGSLGPAAKTTVLFDTLQHPSAIGRFRAEFRDLATLPVTLGIDRPRVGLVFENEEGETSYAYGACEVGKSRVRPYCLIDPQGLLRVQEKDLTAFEKAARAAVSGKL